MEDMTCEQVADWARQVEIGKSTAKVMLDEKIDGKRLKHCTEEDLQKIIPSRGRCRTVIEERDAFLSAEEAKSMPKIKQAVVTKEGKENSLVEGFRNFDTAVSITEKYRRFSKFPESERRITNLLDPVRKYVYHEQLTVAGECGITFARNVIEFAAACMNERTNGVLYVGVRDREILGIGLDDLSALDGIEKFLLQQIKKSFCDEQLDCVMRCIRPIECIEVVPRIETCTFVLEIEIVPKFELCENDFFFTRAPRFYRNQVVYENLKLYKFDDNGLVVEDNVGKFLNLLPKIVKSRKAKEAQQAYQGQKRNVAFPINLFKKLKHALCQGESTLKGDKYPVLVIPPVDDIVDEDYATANFSFMKDINWRVVFDFGADGTLCKFMQSEEFRVKYAEDFDSTSELNRSNPARLQSLKTEFQGPQPLWLYANGHEDGDKSPMDIKDWKQKRRKGLLEFLTFFKSCLNPDRVIIMFLLLSKQYDVMLDAADTLCAEYPEQFVCIAEDESVSGPWMENLLARRCVEKDTLDNRIIVPLPWTQVREVVREISGKESTGRLKLPTVHGRIELPDRIKNQLYDLEVVGANHCDDCTVIKDREKLKELKKEMEEKFYRGSKVDWWNFWFQNQVHKRAVHEELREMVTKCLIGDVPEEDMIGSVTLYHQPGCGGTTIARNILWDLKGSYRCAEVTNVSDDTCEQILKLRSYGESPQVQPKPLVILMDNIDVDQVKNLMAQMREKARQSGRQSGIEIKVFCACLVVVRTSNLPKKQEAHLSCFVKQELIESERDWFVYKYNTLESDQEIDPSTLIAFNILKEDFSRDYINRTVRSYVCGIQSRKEKLLLKFLALLSVYDVDQRPVPLSAFDSFMQEQFCLQKQLWECSLSTDMGMLVNVNSGQCWELGLRTISIFHPLIAQAIMSILRSLDGEQQMLSGFSLTCFDNQFIRSKVTKASQILLARISDTLKHRERFHESKEKFSPIIQEIIADESMDKAIEVLKKGFEITEDPFLAQQIARAYIEAKSWDCALEYAKKAISLIENNCRLYDTLGQVHRMKLEEFYEHLKSKAKTIDVDADIIVAIKIAFEAISIYKIEQRLEKRANMASSVAGYRGGLFVCSRLLDCLSLHSTFKGESKQKKSDAWYDFFSDRDSVPVSIVDWCDVDGRDYIQFLKNIKDEAYMYIKHLEDDSTQVKERYVDEHREQQSVTHLHRLLTEFTARIYKHFALLSDAIPKKIPVEQRQQIRRAQMYGLGGMGLKSIIEFGQKEKLEGLVSLHGIVQENLSYGSENIEDLAYCIGVRLALSCLYPKSDIAKSLCFGDMARLSQRLFYLRSANTSLLEPYLYFIMFNWPVSNSDTTVSPMEINNALSFWAQAFVDKYPQQKHESKPQYKRTILTTFYITKGNGLGSFAYSRLLHKTGESGDRFWKTDSAKTQLRRFTGILIEQGEHVLINVQYGSIRKEKLKILTSYPITNSMQWNKSVSFVIGFTWMGPKAFDVMLSDSDV